MLNEYWPSALTSARTRSLVGIQFAIRRKRLLATELEPCHPSGSGNQNNIFNASCITRDPDLDVITPKLLLFVTSTPGLPQIG